MIFDMKLLFIFLIIILGVYQEMTEKLMMKEMMTVTKNLVNDAKRRKRLRKRNPKKQDLHLNKRVELFLKLPFHLVKIQIVIEKDLKRRRRSNVLTFSSFVVFIYKSDFNFISRFIYTNLKKTLHNESLMMHKNCLVFL